MTDLYPLLLEASLHVKLWGGRKLADVMGKTLPTDDPYGEAWELHDSATIMNGALAGKSLNEVLQQYGAALVGEANNPAEGFPLLAKFLSPDDWLSVQVHPNDEQARRLDQEPRGKTEAWLVLDADPGAKLVIGLQPGTTAEQMAEAIRSNTLEDYLVFAPVHPGDVFFIAANTVHAIGPGILIYEIQQSSDLTYRLYDWGRLDLDGKPRTMHIEKGVEVSNLATVPPITHPDQNATTITMVEGEYFKTVRHALNEEAVTLPTEGRFHALTCINGAVEVTANGETVALQKGQTALIPASLPDFTLRGQGQVLRSFQP